MLHSQQMPTNPTGRRGFLKTVALAGVPLGAAAAAQTPPQPPAPSAPPTAPSAPSPKPVTLPRSSMRYPRGIGIQRDEGAEGVEGHVDGQAGIVEGDLGDGKFAGESGAFEAAEAGGVLGAEAIGAFVGRHEAGFEDVRDGLAAAGLRPDGGECVFG